MSSQRHHGAASRAGPVLLAWTNVTRIKQRLRRVRLLAPQTIGRPGGVAMAEGSRLPRSYCV